MNKAYIEACARMMHPDMDWPNPSDEVEEYVRRLTLGKAMEEIADLIMTPGIGLPYQASYYINVTAYHPWKTGVPQAIDVEATRKNLARVVQTARQKGWEVEKKYDDSYFRIVVTTPSGGKLDFNANRESMCERKVVGTKVIPAQEARTEDIVEYDCNRISLLSLDVGVE